MIYNSIAKVTTDKRSFRISKIIQFLKVSRSGYYRHFITGDQDKDAGDYELIKYIFEERRGRVGIRQIKMLLERRLSLIMSHKKIARIKRKYGLETRIRKRNKYRTFVKKQQEHRVFKNKLNRKFNVKKPDSVYSTDITEMTYGRNVKIYLAAFKDLCTKEIVAYSVSPKPTIQLTTSALNQMLEKRLGCTEKLMVHSDQGFHFTHFSFRRLLKENKIIQSMSRKGNCLDNAPIESLFGHLKDHLDLSCCQTFDEVKEIVTSEIEYYNNHRPQTGLRKMPPVEYRRHLES